MTAETTTKMYLKYTNVKLKNKTKVNKVIKFLVIFRDLLDLQAIAPYSVFPLL